MMKISLFVTYVRPPISQKVIVGSVSYGSPTNFTMEIKAENNAAMTMPVSTSVSVAPPD